MNDEYLGILNTQNIVYAGFVLLGIFLLVIVVYALITLTADTFLTVATMVVSGAALIILAYFIIYSVAIAMGIVDTDNVTEEVIPEAQALVPIGQAYNLPDPLGTINNTQLRIVNDTLYIYWDVIDGVGCCDMEGCIYSEFEEQCITPFRLYNVYLDNVYLGAPNTYPREFEYLWQNCTILSPWNEYTINVPPIGMHELRIVQADCIQIVDIQIINFEIFSNGTVEVQ